MKAVQPIKPSDIVFVYVTAPSVELAKEMAHKIIDQRLAACANIIPSMISVYRWQGEVEETHEASLVFKTQAVLFDALSQAVKAIHPYDCCCIVGLPLAFGSWPFLDWVKAETTSVVH